MTELLIVGAGPFGLAMAAWAEHHDLAYRIIGVPMEFWRRHMPRGMLLRSGIDWHLDPIGEATIERFLAERGSRPEEVEPLGLDLYLDYVEWFRRRKGIEVEDRRLHRLDAGFRARMTDGSTIEAHRVLLALGFRHFQHEPEAIKQIVPEDRREHTCDRVDLDALAGKRCLIVGGRQSAFEWAALLLEAGARSVDLVYRHDTPTFAPSDWSFVDELIVRTLREPLWYRRLEEEERRRLDHRFWAEGRSKLEPWLAERVAAARLWPRTRIVACDEDLHVRLDNGRRLAVDHVVLATGYRVDLHRVPFLRRGDLLSRIELDAGSPVLDTRMQTSLPGLHVTSLPAARTFGPFFGFTVAACASARLVGSAFGVPPEPA